MADPLYSVKKITDLTTNPSANDSDLYVLGNQGTATMRKITFSTIASAILNKLTSFTFNSLTTTSKNLPGAVNELNTKSTTMNSATLGSSVSGLCYYTQLGSIVVVTGTLATSAAKADGDNLATGLPGPATSNGILYAKNNNALNSSYAMQINSDGRLNAFGAIPSGVSLRFFSAYIAL